MSIKIYNEVIIVEGDHNKGYVVEPNNESMLFSAMSWATHFEYEMDENGKYVTYIDAHGNTCRKNTKIEGKQFTYTNGQFELYIYNSAEGSSQGGKLSFWNCKIVTPDNKEFIIGINSKSICELLLNNTFTNGKCLSKVYLGRTDSNVCAYTENLESFKQAKMYEDNRKLSKTSKYKPGDLVGTITQQYVYLGEFKTYIKDEYSSFGWNNRKYTVTISKTPIKYHIYLSFYSNKFSFYIDDRRVRTNKTAMILLEPNKISNVKDEYTKQKIESDWLSFYRPLDEKTNMDEYIDTVIKVYKKCCTSLFSEYNEFYINYDCQKRKID